MQVDHLCIIISIYLEKIEEEGHVFQEEAIYPEITFECGQTNENEFKWHWINHKNESGTELPECIVSSQQLELILQWTKILTLEITILGKWEKVVQYFLF